MAILTLDRDITALLHRASTIAVVGLSDNPSRDSHRVARYLLDHGYTVIPVNPTISSVFGITAFPDLGSIAQPVDIVDVFRRPTFMAGVVHDAISTHAGALWMQFDTVDQSAAEAAAAAGLDVVVDRCIMVEHRRLIK
jgi:predicted CoA-binding protein